jgi:hypothetical protein
MLFAITALANAQPAAPERSAEVSRFDYGKMWTFEHAPLDYFKETYNFEPTPEWWELARMASLRFAGYCSASFVSPDGLILTNHHCSRGEVGKVMQEGEDFDQNGFYAPARADERRVEGLFVKQLVQIADITDFVHQQASAASGDEEILVKRREALRAARSEYAEKEGWEGLEIEPVVYYNGGRFSLYGYKRYDDIRLVLLPELHLGYFGGDPDNFTYPRYNLDMTLWRAYDENGQPVNSSQYYFPFKVEGAAEDELIFTTGNPGSTERYRTMAQLEYDRDARYNVQVTWMQNRINIMQEKYDAQPDHDLLELIFNLANGAKAFGGILEGLHTPRLMDRKAAMEAQIRAQSQALKDGQDYWAEIAKLYDSLKGYNYKRILLSPSPLNGAALQTAFYTFNLIQALEAGADEADLDEAKDEIRRLAAGLDDPYELKYLTALLGELQTFVQPDDRFVAELLKGRSPAQAAQEILAQTSFRHADKLDALLSLDADQMKASTDPLIQMGLLLVPEFQEASMAFRSSGPALRVLEGKIAHEVYQVYGLAIPPDASFTLRLADGLVKKYDYNGTEAPYKTTYYGLYDRYHSQNGRFPWSLPEKWLNPPAELLKTPLNFVATCDITGGNSGSPMINAQGQLIGLVFDGNIESLPGNFIYDPVVNRAVGVHAGGIVAAMKYIYKAQRLLREMGLE